MLNEFCERCAAGSCHFEVVSDKENSSHPQHVISAGPANGGFAVLWEYSREIDMCVPTVWPVNSAVKCPRAESWCGCLSQRPHSSDIPLELLGLFLRRGTLFSGDSAFFARHPPPALPPGRTVTPDRTVPPARPLVIPPATSHPPLSQLSDGSRPGPDGIAFGSVSHPLTPQHKRGVRHSAIFTSHDPDSNCDLCRTAVCARCRQSRTGGPAA